MANRTAQATGYRPPRGRCQHCGYYIQVKRDGTLRQHKDYQRDATCAGAGKPSIEDTTTDRLALRGVAEKEV